jgi:cold shock CspA family protein/ribosome-associated translation inhibitor RaiA
MDPSPAVEARVRDLAARLDHFYDAITRCRVVISTPPAHSHKGGRFSVRIDVTLPRGELFAHSDHANTEAHTDVYVALRDAFDDLRRQLEDYGRRQHGDVKHHEPSELAGTVVELATEEGYGRIETAEGRLVYFHRNSVHGARFESLIPGTKVRFEEEQGNLGPQATAVRPMAGAA